MKRITFIGNCQMAVLYRLFNKTEYSKEIGVSYVRNYAQLTDEDKTNIEGASLIVSQLMQFKAAFQGSELPATIETVWVPMITGRFLWPHGRTDHPTFPASGPGGYPIEMTDGHLGRQIRENKPAEEALAEYLAMDRLKPTSARLYEIVLEQQRERDITSEMNVAAWIEANISTKRAFLTPHHLGIDLAKHVVETIFPRLGCPSQQVTELVDTLEDATFPPWELPVHPLICDQFNLPASQRDRSYFYSPMGNRTFEQFVHQYMTGPWRGMRDAPLSVDMQ